MFTTKASALLTIQRLVNYISRPQQILPTSACESGTLTKPLSFHHSMVKEYCSPFSYKYFIQHVTLLRV
jgi:hypothetical protein